MLSERCTAPTLHARWPLLMQRESRSAAGRGHHREHRVGGALQVPATWQAGQPHPHCRRCLPSFRGSRCCRCARHLQAMLWGLSSFNSHEASSTLRIPRNLRNSALASQAHAHPGGHTPLPPSPTAVAVCLRRQHRCRTHPNRCCWPCVPAAAVLMLCGRQQRGARRAADQQVQSLCLVRLAVRQRAAALRIWRRDLPPMQQTRAARANAHASFDCMTQQRRHAVTLHAPTHATHYLQLCKLRCIMCQPFLPLRLVVVGHVGKRQVSSC